MDNPQPFCADCGEVPVAVEGRICDECNERSIAVANGSLDADRADRGDDDVDD